MARIAEADLRRVTRFLAAAAPGSAADPVRVSTLTALCDLLGADDAEYFELRRADRGVIAHTETDKPDLAPGCDEALALYGHENPLSWRRWGPGDSAMRLSARIDRRALQRLGFYQAYLRPNGATDILKVWLHSSPESAACLQLWRLGGQFTDRDEDLLAVLHQHLRRLRADALSSTAGSIGREASLTRREAEILTWAVRGESDAAIARRLGTSPATVGKHLEHAFAALGVHSRPEALWRLTSSPRDADEEPLAPDRQAGGTLGPG